MPEARWYCPLCQSEGTEPGAVFCRNDGARVRPIAERGVDWIGKVLDDKYKIVRFIDAGGTAEVYEAERVGSEKRVAVKLLHAALAASPEAMAHFLQEAQLVSLIAHPNVVAIQDFGTLPNAVHYMVMELLDGRPLSVEMHRGPLPVLTALKYAMQACEGLAAAHTRDVLHCDIKPANVFLQRVPGESVDGEPIVKILDLGIGRLFARSAPEGDAKGIVAGTPDYMSPEQAMGKPLGAASDIYSMGVTIYEMLLGVLPFVGESYGKLMMSHVHDAPPWPIDVAEARGLPPETRAVVLRALAKEPSERQGSMLDLQRELGGIARLVRAGHAAAEGERAPTSQSGMDAVRKSPSVRTRLPPSDQLFTTEEAPSGRWRVAPERLSLTPPRASLKPPARASMKPPLRASVKPARSGSSKPPRSRVEIVKLADATGGDNEVVEIARDVFWVGRRHGGLLECNAYLRVFRNGDTEVCVLVDPGPPKDLDIVSAKVAAIIGSIRRLDYVFINHQDPDVASNAAPIQQASQRTRVICSEDTFRLAQFYGLDPARFSAVETFPGGRMTLATGHEIHFVPTPFCHFRGAVMLHDPESRVLFSGDLFGGARSSSLVASERSWPGVEMFHSIYMPSKRALALAVARVRRLHVQPTTLAPQHGALVVGDDVGPMLDAIADLDVGLDLLESPERDRRFAAAGDDLVREFTELAGAEGARRLLASHGDDTSFTRLFSLDERGAIAEFKVAPMLALETLAGDALAALPAEQRGDFQRSVLMIWRQHEIDRAGPSPLSKRAIDGRTRS